MRYVTLWHIWCDSVLKFTNMATIRLLNSGTVSVKFLTFFLECTYGDIPFQLPVHKI
jgi:hypothetical protein